MFGSGLSASRHSSPIGPQFHPSGSACEKICPLRASGFCAANALATAVINYDESERFDTSCSVFRARREIDEGAGHRALESATHRGASQNLTATP